MAVFAAIGLYIVNNIEQLRSQPLYFRWDFLLCGLLLTMMGHLSSYAIWTRIAASFDMHTSWRHAGKAWFLSRLGRYIPGKISLLLIRFNEYEGHTKTKISAATIIEAYTSLCAVGLLLLFLGVTSRDWNQFLTPAAASLVLILLVLSHPRALKLALGVLGRILPLPKLSHLPRQRETLGFVTAQLVTMLVHGGALFMTFNAVGHVGSEHYLLVSATAYVASLIGMLAVFAPSGMGVREAALFAMLVQHIEPTILLVGAILIRLLGIASEIVLSSFFVIFARRQNGAADKHV